MTGSDPTDVAVAALETRVEGLEKSVGSVVSAIENLGKKIDAGQRTRCTVIWTALGVGVAFLGMFLVLVYKPIEAELENLHVRGSDARELFDSRIVAAERLAQEVRGFADERSRGNLGKIEKLFSDSATKAEVAERFVLAEKELAEWRSLSQSARDTEIKAILSQITELRGRMASAATPQDAIADLRKRLDETDNFLKQLMLKPR